MMGRAVVVVSGLIVNPQREVLMAKRKDSSVLPGQWEIPGGKVEGGELERDALARELREELGINAAVHNIVSLASFTRNDCRILMLLYACVVSSDQTPKPLESSELRWLDPSDASDRLPCCPSLHAWLGDIEYLLDHGGLWSSHGPIQEFPS